MPKQLRRLRQISKLAFWGPNTGYQVKLVENSPDLGSLICKLALHPSSPPHHIADSASREESSQSESATGRDAIEPKLTRIVNLHKSLYETDVSILLNELLTQVSNSHRYFRIFLTGSCPRQSMFRQVCVCMLYCSFELSAKHGHECETFWSITVIKLRSFLLKLNCLPKG